MAGRIRATHRGATACQLLPRRAPERRRYLLLSRHRFWCLGAGRQWKRTAGCNGQKLYEGSYRKPARWAKDRRKEMKTLLSALLTTAVTLMTLGACKKNEARPPVVRPVRSVVVEKRQVGDPAVGTGHLRARDEVNLAFRIGGRMTQRKLGVGD